ncbi:MAG: GTPase HflX [Candidatus Kapaibacterium thiocyanatum]|uniref:GTPase HflX n=1 Tax=Candidatus Kapaibacterium thiocyanatum TaxID=1895771 RepID=A0A1M3KY67_9BACT|nr:MAG: GTPase HflX ['Candidatus Kapabacteria' thiocyanatum]
MVYEIATLPRERAVIVAVVRKGSDPAIVTEHLDELTLLLDTAGADVAARLYQERERPDISTAIGKGKIEEVKELVVENGCSMVVFDDDLSPAQVRNLEKALEVKVLDRCGVILDIFASRASSVEARTQVELAQLEYLLPRLTRMWTHLSKQFGGVGTKGPGETQIETDRRMYRTRIQRLRAKLSDIDSQRSVQRKSREGMPRFALVGYTNAGKSSLMRVITESDVHIEDRLFATLDTTVRAFALPSGQRALLSDTVGFIRKLPTQLVASFRTTLAETLEADVVLHVVDVANEHFRDHIRVVTETLHDLGAENIPMLLVFNKIDAVEERHLLDDVETEYPGCVFVSAERGINIQRLLVRMQETFEEHAVTQTLMIPYDRMKEVARLYQDAEILSREEKDAGVYLAVRVQSDKLTGFTARYGGFVIRHHDESFE